MLASSDRYLISIMINILHRFTTMSESFHQILNTISYRNKEKFLETKSSVFLISVNGRRRSV
jgi:hypothetical protein